MEFSLLFFSRSYKDSLSTFFQRTQNLCSLISDESSLRRCCSKHLDTAQPTCHHLQATVIAKSQQFVSAVGWTSQGFSESGDSHCSLANTCKEFPPLQTILWPPTSVAFPTIKSTHHLASHNYFEFDGHFAPVRRIFSRTLINWGRTNTLQHCLSARHFSSSCSVSSRLATVYG